MSRAEEEEELETLKTLILVTVVYIGFRIVIIRLIKTLTKGIYLSQF